MDRPQPVDRPPAGAAALIAAALADSLWTGREGRLEVWYATFWDPASGTGFWLHYELLAPTSAPARAHGWAAVFPREGDPVVRRFGPADLPTPGADDGAWFSAAGAVAGPGRLSGSAGELRWDLRFQDDGAPLPTFPGWAFGREWFPGAQVVPYPTARFDGAFEVGDRRLSLAAAPGAVAHIYGHGHAQEWGWLHADLGEGEVLEVVAARPRRAWLRWLPVVTVVALRTREGDWPGDGLLAAPRFRARLGLPRWEVEGSWGGRSLRVEVEVPERDSVRVDYQDPDGAPAVCVNSERASARIVLRGRGVDRRWDLEGTAHAEVGRRPGRRAPTG